MYENTMFANPEEADSTQQNAGEGVGLLLSDVGGNIVGQLMPDHQGQLVVALYEPHHPGGYPDSSSISERIYRVRQAEVDRVTATRGTLENHTMLAPGGHHGQRKAVAG